MRTILSLTALALLAVTAEAETAETEAPTCAEGQAVSFEDLAAAHKAILFGDYHGTQEMPEAFGDAVAEAAGGDRRVVVALEYPANWQPDLDAMMAAPDEVMALDVFARRSTRDGRTSEAMRNLLLQLRALKLAGADVTVRAIDMARPAPNAVSRAAELGLPPEIDQQRGLRNIIMGLNSVEACEMVECDLLMMFSGNAHTRLDVRDSASYMPTEGEITSYREAAAGNIIVRKMPTASVYLSHRGGYARNQSPDGVFGLRELTPTAPGYVAEDRTYYCTGERDRYTHVFSVGPVSPAMGK